MLASRFYLQLYDNEKSIVFENLPVKVNDCSFVQRKVGTGVVKIGFVGSVRHFELLKNLMLAVNNVNNVEFHIYGDGILSLKNIASKILFSTCIFMGVLNMKIFQKSMAKLMFYGLHILINLETLNMQFQISSLNRFALLFRACFL